MRASGVPPAIKISERFRSTPAMRVPVRFSLTSLADGSAEAKLTS